MMQPDFQLRVASFGDVGIFGYESRPDILNDYPAPNIIRPPRSVGVIHLEKCSHDEGTATTFAAAMSAVSMGAGNVCGYRHWGMKRVAKWTLSILVDSRWVQRGLTEGVIYGRIGVILGRAEWDMSWFQTDIQYEMMTEQEVIHGKETS